MPAASAADAADATKGAAAVAGAAAAAAAPPEAAPVEGAAAGSAPVEAAPAEAAPAEAAPAEAAETPPPLAELGTGSVVQFYYNDHLLTRFYAWLTGKKCAHVGIVVKDPKYPKKREGFFLLESGFEGFDTGGTPAGVRLVPLAEAVAGYGSSMVYVRHLVAKPEGFALGPLLSELTSRTPCGQKSAWRDQYKAAGRPRPADGAAAAADATHSDLAAATEPAAEEAAAPADWSAALAAYVFGSFGGTADAWRTAEPGLFDTADETLPPFPEFRFAPAVPLVLPASPVEPAK